MTPLSSCGSECRLVSKHDTVIWSLMQIRIFLLLSLCIYMLHKCINSHVCNFFLICCNLLTVWRFWESRESTKSSLFGGRFSRRFPDCITAIIICTEFYISSVFLFLKPFFSFPPCVYFSFGLMHHRLYLLSSKSRCLFELPKWSCSFLTLK